MAKTCIVCGGPAGSKEHVFPAALGGRRTNSGIYCTKHDNSYSGLVGEIAGQIDFLNAYLGVRPDHSSEIKITYADEPLTGKTIAISADAIKFLEPRIISRAPAENGEALQVAFPDRQSANQWITDMQDKGYTVSVQSKPTEGQFMLGQVRHRRALGGACGLGAVAYFAQTFFAQEFQEIARSGALSDLVAYTQAIAKVAVLGGCEQADEESEELVAARAALAISVEAFGESGAAWWDFSPPTGPEPNAFKFGHRVTVGVDGSDCQIYGCVSLFSAFNFAVWLGTAPQGSETREVTVDIDPLAEHPPKDISKLSTSAAPSRVNVPNDPTEGLADAIASGAAKQALDGLLQRLIDHQLANLALVMGAALAPCSSMPAPEARALIERTIDEQSQQVWRAATYAVQIFQEGMVNDNLSAMAQKLDVLVAYDVKSTSGLSSQAEVTLALAKTALAAQMEQDCATGLLDEERIADLMGRGPGLLLISQALLSQFQQALGCVV